MKTRIFDNVLRGLAAGLLITCAWGCRDAGEETYELTLEKLLRPISISFSGINSDYVTVSWKGSGSRFELQYSVAEDFSTDITTIEGITKNSHLVTELREGTHYYFRVKGFSSKAEVAASEYSPVAGVRTLQEPRIPNVAAEDKMEYTVDPWSVTSTITVTWGMDGIEPEAVSSIRVTAAKDSQNVMTFPVSEQEAGEQKKEFSEGIEISTAYNIELLVGTKVRGSVAITTKPGPTPTLSVVSNLDFETVPMSVNADVRWELYYVEPSTLDRIEIVNAGDVTVAQVAITAEHIADGGVSGIAGLETDTEYTARLIADDSSVIAQETFRTQKGLSSTIIVARPEDDLAALINDDARISDTIYLMPGVHTIPSDAVGTTIKRNLVLTSNDPSRTVVNSSKALYVGETGTYDRIVFSNIRFNCTGYLMQANGTFAYDIDLLRIDNCTVNLNSTASGNSTLFSNNNTNAAGGRIKEFAVKNSTVFANSGQVQNIVYNSASSATGYFGKMTLENSTFSTCNRGIIFMPATSGDREMDISIDHCTFYGMQQSSNNNAFIDIRVTGAAPRSLRLSNSIVHFGGTTYRWLQFASGNNFTASAENVYYFNGQTPAYSGTTAINALTSYSSAPATMWVNSQADPTSAGASFRIKDNDLLSAQESAGTTLGDQRWK